MVSVGVELFPQKRYTTPAQISIQEMINNQTVYDLEEVVLFDLVEREGYLLCMRENRQKINKNIGVVDTAPV